MHYFHRKLFNRKSICLIKLRLRNQRYHQRISRLIIGLSRIKRFSMLAYALFNSTFVALLQHSLEKLALKCTLTGNHWTSKQRKNICRRLRKTRKKRCWLLKRTRVAKSQATFGRNMLKKWTIICSIASIHVNMTAPVAQM